MRSEEGRRGILFDALSLPDRLVQKSPLRTNIRWRGQRLRATQMQRDHLNWTESASLLKLFPPSDRAVVGGARWGGMSKLVKTSSVLNLETMAGRYCRVDHF